jgi:hypothetical protein
MTKQFMVIFLQNDVRPDFTAATLHSDYDTAFDVFNRHIAELQEQIFKRPKGEKPLRASLQFGDLELWIVTRTTDLITN